MYFCSHLSRVAGPLIEASRLSEQGIVLISTIDYSAIENASEKYAHIITILSNVDLSMTSWAERRPVFVTVGLNITRLGLFARHGSDSHDILNYSI